MGSTERSDPEFVAELRESHHEIANLTDHELASWIVARLNYLTSGDLCAGEVTYSHDTNEFGYKVKVSDDSNRTLAHGAIVIHADRTYLRAVNSANVDYQSLLVELLVGAVNDLGRCSVRVQVPETRQFRHYGWDGYSFIS